MSAVAELYDRWADYQWRRLEVMPCELFVHLRTLRRHLPAGARVLDLGAGPGRYALELLADGHRLVVGDLSPVQVAAARERLAAAGFEPGADGPLERVLELDARDLGRFADESFDAVVCFGPFYHLQAVAERRHATAEVARVLRPGGLLFAALMPRPYWLGLALHNFLADGEPQDPRADEHLRRLEGLLDHGVLEGVRSPQLKHGWFCQVAEVEPWFAAFGFEPVDLLASSGVTGPWSRPEVWRRLDQRPPAVRLRFLELVLRSARDPHVLALSDQVLYVGRRQPAPSSGDST